MQGDSTLLCLSYHMTLISRHKDAFQGNFKVCRAQLNAEPADHMHSLSCQDITNLLKAHRVHPFLQLQIFSMHAYTTSSHACWWLQWIILVLQLLYVVLNIDTPQGQTPLHVAARLNRADIASLLVAHGSNSSAQDDNVRTSRIEPVQYHPIQHYQCCR